MRSRTAVLAAMLAMAPLGATAADLVVWWEKGFNPEEDAAVREIIAAFEQGSGKQVELVFQQQEELPDVIAAAFEAGQPPDFAFGHMLQDYVGQWAFEDRLADLSDAVGPSQTCSIRRCSPRSWVGSIGSDPNRSRHELGCGDEGIPAAEVRT